MNGPVGKEGLTYSFFHKNAYVIGLDQYTAGQHHIPQAWFEQQLGRAGKHHVFVFGHEPAFETGHKDNLSFYAADRDRFWNALGKAGGQLYFCGHDHFYDRSRVADGEGHPIRQIIAGTGGGNLRTWTGAYGDTRVAGERHVDGRHGYVLVTVEGANVTVLWKALSLESGGARWDVQDTFVCTRTDLP